MVLSNNRKKNSMIQNKLREGRSGNCYVVKTVMIGSLQTLAAIFSPDGLC